MADYQSLNHTKWECKYHFVFIPKCRRKVLFASCGRTWVKCFGAWPSRRRAELKKGKFCRTMCTC